MVHYIIKKYFPSFVGSDIYDDIFQMGSIGLFKASQKFDESLGFKFSTYCTKYIAGYIKTYLRSEIKYNSGIKDLISISDNEFIDDSFLETYADETTDIQRDIESSDGLEYYMNVIRSIKATPNQKFIYEDYIWLSVLDKKMTMKEFGKRHNLSRQRVIKIINKMNKLAVIYINRAKTGDEVYQLPEPKVRVSFI